MVRDGPAPLRSIDWNAVDDPARPAFPNMFRAGRASQRINRKMFGDEQGIVDEILHTRQMDVHLETAGLPVVGESQIKNLAGHFVTGRLRRILSWAVFRTTDRLLIGSVPPFSSACHKSDIL